MRAYDIIKKKRDGRELSEEEIRFMIGGLTSGEIPDYQISAWLMAVYFRGMSENETLHLTEAIRDSGEKSPFSHINGIKADKHSTGGVGDKTSLIVAPIVACYGVKVAKMSGRGLGHTGGTIDKLDSIDGFKTDLSPEEAEKVVNKTGLCIIGQTARLAPADKLLYALRDVTATVDSLPLIVSSIMGKKLAADDDVIVLDVKTGSGAFMKTYEESVRLAEAMVKIGERAGKKICALITNMDKPLGRAIGNSIEVTEAIQTLNGKGEKDLTDLSVELAANILLLSGKGDGDIKNCRLLAKKAISSGKALNKLIKTVVAQGGKSDLILHPENFKKARFFKEFQASQDGYVYKVNAEKYGEAAILLGAGRAKKDDEIDYAAGLYLNKIYGEFVKKGETIATMYSNDEKLFSAAEQKLRDGTVISGEKPLAENVVIAKID